MPSLVLTTSVPTGDMAAWTLAHPLPRAGVGDKLIL